MNKIARSPGFGVAAVGMMLGLLAQIGGGAQADEDEQKLRAQTLFVEGRKEIDKGDFVAGCPKVRESLTLFTVANSLFTVAQCDEQEGKIAAAFEHWERGLALIDAKDPRAKIAKERIEALDVQVPRIRVVIPPTSASVTVLLDGAELVPAMLATFVRVEPGKHVFIVRASGRQDATRELKLAEKERTEFVATLGPPVEAGSSSKDTVVKPSPSGTAVSPPPSPTSPRRTVGAIVAGVGVLGLVGAGITSAFVYGVDTDLAAFDKSCAEGLCNWSARPEMVDKYKALLTANTVLFGVGIAGIAAGMSLILTAPRKSPANAVLVPFTVNGGYGMSVFGRF